MNEELFKKFINDQCSQEELEEIMQGADSPAQKAQIFALLEKKWNESDIQIEPDVVYQNLLLKIADRISKQEGVKNSGVALENPPSFRVYPDYLYYAKVAASIVILVTVSAVFISSFLKGQKDNQLPEVNYIVKSTAIGEKLKIRLPDRTLVNLNSASSIKYPDHFSGAKREVFLEGEAFFDVNDNPEVPFMVHSNELTTTALGTSFNIRAINGEVKVALTTGKVKVALANSKTQEELIMYLVPGEMAIYQKREENILKEKFDTEEVIGWKEGIINFKHASIPDIILKLERWYGVAIILDPQLLQAPRFTGSINNQNLESILLGLCFSLECEYNIKGENVEIMKK